MIDVMMHGVIIENLFKILMNNLPIEKEPQNISNCYAQCSPDFLHKKTNLMKVLYEMLSLLE